jgi:hypothetical protein
MLTYGICYQWPHLYTHVSSFHLRLGLRSSLVNLLITHPRLLPALHIPPVCASDLAPHKISGNGYTLGHLSPHLHYFSISRYYPPNFALKYSPCIVLQNENTKSTTIRKIMVSCTLMRRSFDMREEEWTLATVSRLFWISPRFRRIRKISKHD